VNYWLGRLGGEGVALFSMTSATYPSDTSPGNY
jgi:hypothetical protein